MRRYLLGYIENIQYKICENIFAQKQREVITTIIILNVQNIKV